MQAGGAAEFRTFPGRSLAARKGANSLTSIPPFYIMEISSVNSQFTHHRGRDS